MTFRRLSLPLAALLVTAAAPPPSEGTLTIEVANVRASKGRVHIDVCPEARFLKSGCAYSASAVARKGVTTVVVPNVAAGRYAVQAYFDENGNGKMDFGLFGLPKEGFGFSRDPKVTTRAPTFDQAAFDATGAAQSLALHLHYVL